MKTTIPKIQAYLLTGGTLLLICCVCTLLAAWRFWPTRPAAAAVAAYPIVYDGTNKQIFAIPIRLFVGRSNSLTAAFTAN